MRYKAIIFDLDGTLLDTISDILNSMNSVLARYNYNTHSEEEYKYFVGKGVDVLVDSIIKTDNLPKDQFSVIKTAYYQEYDKRADLDTKPYPGIVRLLNNLKAKGFSLNILSNKPHHQTVNVINKYFKNIKFDNIYGKKPEFEIKPNPDSVFAIISNLGLTKNEVVFVGDTSVDIETANNAEIDSIGVLWGFRKREELERAKATFIVSHPEEILEIVLGE